MKSGECLHTFQGGIGGSSAGIRINSVHSLPRNVDQFALCNKSSTLFIMNMQGQVKHAGFNFKEITIDVTKPCVLVLNPYQFNVAFHIETNYLFCKAK